MKANNKWLEERLNGIGGSDAPIIMETSPWSTPQILWEIKTRRREEDPQTYPMRRGLKLEPIARAVYEAMTGTQMPSQRIKHNSIEFVRANLDGINWEKSKALEIKCPGREDHQKALKGKIPEKYLYQLVHNCLAANVDTLDYFSFDGEKGVIVPFERDLKLEKKLLAREYPFWECVQKNIPPKKNEEEVIMNPKTLSPYTAREVVEILQKAKALGVIHMKLDGFEAAFDLSKNERLTLPLSAQECPNCATSMTDGLYGLYCKPCYLEKKNRKEFFQVRKHR